MVIKVLGTGCKNCAAFYENVKKAIEGTGKDIQLEKVYDMEKIVGYGVMSIPALVIDEKVVSYGKVLSPAEVSKIIEKVS